MSSDPTQTPPVASDPEIARRRFELVSDYTPSGDQPRAIAELVQGLEAGDTHQVLLGATGTGKSLGYDDPVFVVERDGSRTKTRVMPIGALVDAAIEGSDEVVRRDDTELLDLGDGDTRYMTQAIDPRTGEVGLFPIRSLIRHDAPATMYRLALKCGREATLTGNHNLWVLRDGALALIETEDVRETDHVPLPRQLARATTHDSIDLLESLEGTKLRVSLKGVVEEFVEDPSARRELAELLSSDYVDGNHKITRIVRGDETTDIETTRRLVERTSGFDDLWDPARARVGTRFMDCSLPTRLELSSEFAYFIGVYIAEGNSQAKYSVVSNHSPTVRNALLNVLDEIDVPYHVRESSDIAINSLLIKELLQYSGGAKSRDKHLPPYWPDLSDDLLGSMLRGYFDGDGSVEKLAVTCTTASKTLASDLCYALSRFGIWARRSTKFKRATNSATHEGDWYHQVTISGQDDLARFAEHVGFEIDYKKTRLDALLHGRGNTNVDLVPIDGANIRTLRKELGVSAKVLAQASGLSRAAISTYERNTRKPSHTSLLTVLGALEEFASGLEVSDEWTTTWSRLRHLCDARWSRVESLDTLDDYAHPYVYDFCVPGPETFLGGWGGMFVHNTYAIANVIEQTQRPTLVMAPNKTLAAQLYSEFKEFFPNNAVEYFVSYYDYYQPEAYIPSTDTFIEKDSAINDAIDRMRHAATRSLFERRDVIIVASVSCIYGLGSSEAYLDMLLFLEEGAELSRRRMLKKLVEIQYERNDLDFHRGTFRVRGDTVEIFPAHEEDRAIRVEMFGDEIEAIYEIDPLRGRRVRQLDRIAIYPNSHYVIPEDRKKTAIESIQEELKERLEHYVAYERLIEAQRVEQRTQYDLEMMVTMGYCKGIENYSRHLSGRDPGEAPPCLLDYFPSDWLLVIDESHVTVPQVGGMFRGDQARKASLIDHGFRLPSALDNRPLKFEEFEEMVNQVIHVSATPGNYEIDKTEGVVVEQIIRPTGLVDPIVEVRPALEQVDDVYGEVRTRVEKGERVLITTLTKRMSEDLTEYLTELGIKVRYLHSDIDTIERMNLIRDLRKGVFDVLVGINLLREGLDIPEVSLVAILDADKEGFLRSTRSLIQTIGRAARNAGGKAILYADKKTKSMKEAIEETERRRAVQEAYNEEHGIIPKTIIKRIHDLEEHIPEDEEAATAEGAEATQAPTDLSDLDPDALRASIASLEQKMREAAKNLEFEDAARYRDEMRRFEVLLFGLTR